MKFIRWLRESISLCFAFVGLGFFMAAEWIDPESVTLD